MVKPPTRDPSEDELPSALAVNKNLPPSNKNLPPSNKNLPPSNKNSPPFAVNEDFPPLAINKNLLPLSVSTSSTTGTAEPDPQYHHGLPKPDQRSRGGSGE